MIQREKRIINSRRTDHRQGNIQLMSAPCCHISATILILAGLKMITKKCHIDVSATLLHRAVQVHCLRILYPKMIKRYSLFVASFLHFSIDFRAVRVFSVFKNCY